MTQTLKKIQTRLKILAHEDKNVFLSLAKKIGTKSEKNLEFFKSLSRETYGSVHDGHFTT